MTQVGFRQGMPLKRGIRPGGPAAGCFRAPVGVTTGAAVVHRGQ
ncbi:hypothetical protein [Streptomyces chartreusis]